MQLHQVDTVQTELTQRRLAAFGHAALGEHLLDGQWRPELVLRTPRLNLRCDERSRPRPGPKREPPTTPFLRTFAPFVAGVAHMTRTKFTFYDVLGGGLWVGGVTTAGYFFGNIPWVQ